MRIQEKNPAQSHGKQRKEEPQPEHQFYETLARRVRACHHPGEENSQDAAYSHSYSAQAERVGQRHGKTGIAEGCDPSFQTPDRGLAWPTYGKALNKKE